MRSLTCSQCLVTCCAVVHCVVLWLYSKLSITYLSFEAAVEDIDLSSVSQLPDSHLSVALGQQISSPNRLLAGRESYATIAVGMPDLVSTQTE